MPSDRQLSLKRITKRVGLGGFNSWRGIDKRGDRGRIPQDQFSDLVNLRNFDGAWDVRGGLSTAVNTNQLTGCVDGIIDIGGSPTVTSFLVNGTYPNFYSGDDSLSAVNVVQDTPTITSMNMQSVMPLAGASAETLYTPRRVLCLHNGITHFINSSNGISTLILPDTPQTSITDNRIVSVLVDTLPVLGTPNFIHSAFGKLWIIDTGGALMSWDGSTVELVEDTFGSGANLVCSYRENIYVVTPTAFQRQNFDGTWTSLALPSLSGTFHPRCIVECPTVDKLYFGGVVENGDTPEPILIAYNGTSCTTVFNTGVSSYQPVEFYHGVTDVVEWNGVATFCWFDEDSEVALAYIGTVASPTAVTIGGTTTARPAACSLLVDSDNVLYASINPAYDAGNNNHVIQRDGTTLAGSWPSDASPVGWTSLGTWGVGGTNKPPFQLYSFL